MTIFQVDPPSVLNTVGKQLVDTGDYEPENGVTKCNLFLDAFVSQAFAYTAFHNQSANACVDLMRRGKDGWTRLFDDKTDAVGKLGDAFASAQNSANAGFLVLVGLRVDGGSGHLAVVVTGTLSQSTSWAQAGLPAMLPVVAQAGKDVFCGKHLGFGISPESYNAGDLVLFERRP